MSTGMLSDESEDEVENIDPYRRKYQLLSERCEVLQQDNERLAFRTQETRRQRNRLRRLRKAIMDRLDKYGDAWRTAPLMIPDPAAQTTVKTEKVSPKVSQHKGVPAQKAKTPSMSSGSEKSSQKVSKSAASGSSMKRKSISKAEKLDHDQNIVLKHPNNPFFVFCDDDQPPLMSMQSMDQRPLDHEPSDIELNKHLSAPWNTPSTDEKIYYNVYEQFKEQNVGNMDVYKGEIPATTST